MGSTDGKDGSEEASAKTPLPDQSRIEVKRRTISPYDLSSSDNPGSVISQPPLKGPNYNEWATNLRMALKARKKFGFVDGSISQPHQDSQDFDDWWTNNALILSWIKLTINESVRSNLSHLEIASDYWEHIRRRYSVNNGQRVQRIKAELATCRQHGLSIEQYYGKLMQLWTSLAEHRITKNCGCPVGENLEKEREEDRLHEFLKGLDESLYGSVKSNLLSRDPLPSLDVAYSALLQDEDSKHTTRVLDERVDHMSHAVRTNSVPATSSGPSLTREERMKLHCNSCGRKGHLVANCFRTLGYPEWWGDRPHARFPSGNNGGRGNTTAARSTTSDPARAQAVTHSTQTQHAAHALTPADRVGLTGLTETQWNTLVTMLNEHKPTTNTLSGKSTVSSWIVDSGATNHMTGSLAFLSDIREIVPLPVKLPDGHITLATQRGTVIFSSLLTVQNVLFVEGLQCHLISVSQLTRQKRCMFQVTDKIGLIQDRITKILIGVAEESGGLYFLRGMEFAGAMHQEKPVTSDVWHHRLGHPSYRALVFLSISLPTDSMIQNKPCEICIRAKQTRCTFPTSINKTTTLFEMVHCDLWGPYRTTSRCGSRYFLTLVDDYSRSVWLYLLPTKQHVTQSLKNFITMVQVQFDTRVLNSCVSRHTFKSIVYYMKPHALVLHSKMVEQNENIDISRFLDKTHKLLEEMFQGEAESTFIVQTHIFTF